MPESDRRPAVRDPPSAFDARRTDIGALFARRDTSALRDTHRAPAWPACTLAIANGRHGPPHSRQEVTPWEVKSSSC